MVFFSKFRLRVQVNNNIQILNTVIRNISGKKHKNFNFLTINKAIRPYYIQPVQNSRLCIILC